MVNSLTKIIELIKKTGDNCIVLDPQGEPAYVVVGFKNYQQLIEGTGHVSGLTQDELLDKINRDIAAWKNSQTNANSEQWDLLDQTLAASQSQIKSVVAIQPVAKLNPVNNEKAQPLANNLPVEDKYDFEPIE